MSSLLTHPDIFHRRSCRSFSHDGMDLSTRVLPSFVRWILGGIPGWELTAAGVLMNAGRGGGIIGERMFALIERGGEGCVMALTQFFLSLSLSFSVLQFSFEFFFLLLLFPPPCV